MTQYSVAMSLNRTQNLVVWVLASLAKFIFKPMIDNLFTNALSIEEFEAFLLTHVSIAIYPCLIVSNTFAC